MATMFVVVRYRMVGECERKNLMWFMRSPAFTYNWTADREDRRIKEYAYRGNAENRVVFFRRRNDGWTYAVEEL